MYILFFSKPFLLWTVTIETIANRRLSISINISSFVLIHCVSYEHPNVQQGAVEAQSQSEAWVPKHTGVMPSACTSRFLLAHLCRLLNLDNAVGVMTGYELYFSKISIPPLESTQTPCIRWVLSVFLCPWTEVPKHVADQSSSLVPRLREGAAMSRLSLMTSWLIERKTYCHFCMWILSPFYEKTVRSWKPSLERKTELRYFKFIGCVLFCCILLYVSN